MTQAEALAAWVVGPVEVPPQVRAVARAHLLDGLGTALAALRGDQAAAVLQVATGLGGPPEASPIGLTQRLSAPAAALASGALVHALDFDDTHPEGLVHATAVVAPAALAVGQQVAATGREVLDAVVVGNEVVCRVGAAAPHGFHERGAHATMVAGVFSAAAVACRLMQLDPRRTTHALGIAGSQAGGLMAFLGSTASTKQLHPGFASHAGILAARLAAAGATGPANVFEGPYGVYDVFADGAVDVDVVSADLGRSWETSRIIVKPYPTCQLAHAAMDAVLAARATHAFVASEVRSIEVDVHPDSAQIVCDVSRDLVEPAGPYAAKFSLPWSVAALVVDDNVGIGTYSPESIARPEVRDLARRVSWRLTSRAGSAADAPGQARVVLQDGTAVVGAVDCSSGGARNPMTREQLLGKFTGNAGAGGAPVVTEVTALDDRESIEPLMRSLALAADLS